MGGLSECLVAVTGGRGSSQKHRDECTFVEKCDIWNKR